jgi:hypothetical protein
MSEVAMSNKDYFGMWKRFVKNSPVHCRNISEKKTATLPTSKGL